MSIHALKRHVNARPIQILAALALATLPVLACSSSAKNGAGNTSSAGDAGAGAGGGSAGLATGPGGNDAGLGGSNAGLGGSDAGLGGSDAGLGGSDAGPGGAPPNAAETTVRVSNVDDLADVYLNGTKIIEEGFLGDSQVVDITPMLAAGPNLLRMTEFNLEDRWTYGFSVTVNGAPFFAAQCGTAILGGSNGCNNDDLTLGLVYDHTIDLRGSAPSSGRALLHDATDISVGGNSACAVRTNGTVVCWGDNSNGQLGNGSTTSSRVPVAVSGLTGATSVSCSHSTATTNSVLTYHDCAVITDGSVLCWGGNTYGQLGNGSNARSLVPVSAGGLMGATAVSAGTFHSCALLKDGSVACWGDNTFGELGNGSTTSSLKPVSVNGIVGATMVSAGNSADAAYTCAIIAGGTVSCWGVGLLLPVAMPGITGATSISTQNGHACVVSAGGSVQCWGANSLGQLGNGSTTDSSVPVPVSGITAATAVANGYGGACALLKGGTVQCWGNNAFGALGNGTNIGSLVPVPVPGLVGVAQISSGFPVCARLASGEVDCWGDNTSGDLGNNSSAVFLVPIGVSELLP